VSEGYPQLQIASRHEWRDWLTGHHATSPGVWVVTWKRGRGPYVPYDDLVEEAICFGWVDSLPRTVDADRSGRLLTPRKPTGNWSRVNKARVARLTEAGLMAQAGLAAVELAQRNGTWTALDAVEDLHEPDDLRTALDADPVARSHWDAFPRSAKRAVLEWIATAKADATRARRVAETVTQAAANRRANQWRQP